MTETLGVAGVVAVVVRRVREEHGRRGGALQVLDGTPAGSFLLVAAITTQRLTFLAKPTILGSRRVYAIHLQ